VVRRVTGVLVVQEVLQEALLERQRIQAVPEGPLYLPTLGAVAVAVVLRDQAATVLTVAQLVSKVVVVVVVRMAAHRCRLLQTVTTELPEAPEATEATEATEARRVRRMEGLAPLVIPVVVAAAVTVPVAVMVVEAMAEAEFRIHKPQIIRQLVLAAAAAAKATRVLLHSLRVMEDCTVVAVLAQPTMIVRWEALVRRESLSSLTPLQEVEAAAVLQLRTRGRVGH
jgi:hypothetical protein